MFDSRLNVEIIPSARREIKKLSHVDILMVKEVISYLEINLFPEGCKKIHGYPESVYRIRTNDNRYRIVYKADSKTKKAVILRVALRKDVYKKLHKLIKRV